MLNVTNLYDKIDKLFVGDSVDISKYESVEFVDHVVESGVLKDMVMSHLFGNDVIHGDILPFDDCENTIKFRPGEFTVWNGINGHGKSAMVNQILMGFICQGSKCLIASLEMRPQETLSRLICQSYAIEEHKIAPKAVHGFFEKIEGQLYIYKEMGDMEAHRVHALCRYAKAELDIDHILIDSMMKCGVEEGDTAGEKKFINTLQNIAKTSGIHIHLITHAKKGLDEYHAPGKFDVHGSAHITNLPDNVIIISRNKRKEDEKAKPNPNQEILEKPDAFMRVVKQRHGSGWEGAVGLWFHPSRHYSKYANKHRSMI